MPPSPVHYYLHCEQCQQNLGRVSTPAELTGLPGAAVLGLWPEMSRRVLEHEAGCHGKNGATPPARRNGVG